MATRIVNGDRAVAREGSDRAVVRVGTSGTAAARQSATFEGLPYPGPYEVTPTLYEQVLMTRSRTLRDDVTVHEIPCVTTTNAAGGYTYTIAS